MSAFHDLHALATHAKDTGVTNISHIGVVRVGGQDSKGVKQGKWWLRCRCLWCIPRNQPCRVHYLYDPALPSASSSASRRLRGGVPVITAGARSHDPSHARPSFSRPTLLICRRRYRAAWNPRAHSRRCISRQRRRMEARGRAVIPEGAIPVSTWRCSRSSLRLCHVSLVLQTCLTVALAGPFPLFFFLVHVVDGPH